MEKKDLNQRLRKEETGKEESFKEEGETKYSEEAKGVAEVNVKNASASGDGALGRKEEELNNNDNSKNAEID
jgi:hypothetical protein